MQVFWVSGPVGRIRSINLSFKTVVIGVATLVLGLLMTGSVLQFLGFRMALEYDPQIARRLGNLHTALELESLNAVYHARLGELEAEHRKLIERVTELQSAHGRLTELLPASVRKELPNPRAQGGVYLPVSEALAAEPGSVLGRMNQVLRLKRTHHDQLGQELKLWQSSVGTLEGLPLRLPVQAERLSISSGFGQRLDPLNRQPAMHSGLDFELPVGSPLLAAGAGVVTEAGWDPQYGYTVVLQHQAGHASRYAHASALLVAKGDRVGRGQLIARSGNTGRSTGPHLHFEILRQGQPVNPAPYLLGLHQAR